MIRALFDRLQSSAAYQRLLARHQSLADRDRLALNVLTVFLLLIVVVFGLIRPAQQYLANAKARYAEQNEILSWMEANRRHVQAGNDSGAKPVTGNELLSVANSSAGPFTLSFKRIEPNGDNGLSIWIEGVAFNNLINWLDALTRQYLIAIDELSIERTSDQNAVNVRLVITS